MKFAILHHGECSESVFHYRIDAAGTTTPELSEAVAGAHRLAIGIVVEGDLETQPPTAAQLASLRVLLLQLKQRYPDIEIGGHRQVRGDDTTCPGKQFPLTALRQWAKSDLVAQRDASMQEEIDRQYYRR